MTVLQPASQEAFPAPAVVPELRRKCACGGESEEECPECKTKREAVQRVSSSGDAGLEAPPIVEDVLGTPGQPLAESARRTLEPSFGHDFGQVRVHDDARAAESASAVNANAYTVGNHVVFGSGKYAPGTTDGNRLLAHQLMPTIQQTVHGHSARVVCVLRSGGKLDLADTGWIAVQLVGGLDLIRRATGIAQTIHEVVALDVYTGRAVRIKENAAEIVSIGELAS